MMKLYWVELSSYARVRMQRPQKTHDHGGWSCRGPQGGIDPPDRPRCGSANPFNDARKHDEPFDDLTAPFNTCSRRIPERSLRGRDP